LPNESKAGILYSAIKGGFRVREEEAYVAAIDHHDH
jgi:hypothetical protein